MKKVSVKTLCFILFGVGLVFRFYYYASHVNFAQDQARDLMIVEEIANQGKFFVPYGTKVSVADFLILPFYHQILMVVGRLTNFYPLAPHWLYVIAESLTPVFLFLTLKFFIRIRFAFFTALIYLVSPAATIYGTFFWSPNLIPLFTSASIFSFMSYYFLRKKHFLIWGSFLPLLAFHLHLQAGLMMLFYLGFLLWCVKTDKKNLKYILLGWGLAFLPLIPYLAAESQNHWNNTLKAYTFFTGEHSRIYDRVSKPDFILKFIPGFFERVFFNVNYRWQSLGFALLAGGMTLLGWLSYRDKKKYLILFLLIMSMLIMVRVYKGDKLDYYLSAIFMIPYFLLGLIVNQLKKFGLVLAFIVLGFSCWATISIPHENGYKNMEEVISFIMRYSDEGVDISVEEPDFTHQILYGMKERQVFSKEGSQTKVLICAVGGICPVNEIKKSDEIVIGPYAVVVGRKINL